MDGQGSGPVLQRTRPPSLGSHAPCSSLPLGVSRSLAIMTPASRPSVCWMGECRDGAVTAVHGQPPRGQCQRNVRRFVAALSWVWMEPIIPIGNGRAQLPEVWQGKGQMKKPDGNKCNAQGGRQASGAARIHPKGRGRGRSRERSPCGFWRKWWLISRSTLAGEPWTWTAGA